MTGPRDADSAAEAAGQVEEGLPLSDCGSEFEVVEQADNESEGDWTLV